MNYYRKLTKLVAAIHWIGVNYNQVVKLLHCYTVDRSVHVLLKELIRLTQEATVLQDQTVALTIDS